MNNLNVAKIQLNGISYEINDGTNLNDLLNKLKIKKNKVSKLPTPFQNLLQNQKPEEPEQILV